MAESLSPEPLDVGLPVTCLTGLFRPTVGFAAAELDDRIRRHRPNLITWPSRTGDIEWTIHLRAHGPRSLHIILVDDEETPAAG